MPLYTTLKEALMEKAVDLVNDTVKCALLASTYTFSADHAAWADVSAHEISGAGYSAGGATLASKTVNPVAGVGVFDAADVAWTTATITARYAVLYDVTAANKLIGCFDFGGNFSCTAGTFTIQWSANGIVRLA